MPGAGIRSSGAFGSGEQSESSSIQIKKLSIKDMCKMGYSSGSEAMRNLISMNLSLIQILIESGVITEEKLSKQFKLVKQYTNLIKSSTISTISIKDKDNDDDETILKETVADSLIKLPKFLKGDL